MSDGAELCLRYASRTPAGPICVLRSFATGRLDVVPDAWTLLLFKYDNRIHVIPSIALFKGQCYRIVRLLKVHIVIIVE